MAKRGIVVTYYFPPSGGGGVQRWTKLIKYLSRQNWEFCVITAEIEESSPTDSSLLGDIPAATRIVRPEPKTTNNTFLKKIMNNIPRGYVQRWASAFIHVTDSRKNWNRQVIPLIDKELAERKYDVMIISMPPYSTAELAAYYTENLDIPVVFDMRDPWVINPYKIHPTVVHKNLDKRSENRNLSKIKYVVSAYDSIVQAYRKFTGIKFCVIPNGYDEEDFVDFKNDNPDESQGFNLAFSGSFYSHLNNPERLFRALQILKEEGTVVHFHHIGTSVLNLERMAKKYNIQDRVKILGYQDHKECLEILSSMDAFCVILDSQIEHADKTIGGKVYEYLRFRKPIMALVPKNGEAADLIKKTDSGIVCQEDTPQEIAECLRRIISGKTKFSFINIEIYKRENQAGKLDSFLSELIETHEN